MALSLPFQRATIATAAASAILALRDVSDPDRAVFDLSTLLVIDGDSLAHRAYHALPQSIRGKGGRPANALVGFANFLQRLWEAELPDAVFVGWDTLEVPTYRHEALPGYQAGREFEGALLEQLDALPALVASFGFAYGKAPGYEADDFLAAAAAHWKGPVVIATSDRDAFQLVSDRVSILQPVKGVSELSRVGPAEVRERYGVDPGQVVDFIALRGDGSDRIPGAPGVGPKKAASLLAQYGSLEAALEAGRFSAVADRLRLYRRIAQMDAGAPLPKLAATPPDWAGAAEHARELGLNALAKRLAERAAA
jgi:DNA polymerase-1